MTDANGTSGRRCQSLDLALHASFLLFLYRCLTFDMLAHPADFVKYHVVLFPLFFMFPLCSHFLPHASHLIHCNHLFRVLQFWHTLKK